MSIVTVAGAEVRSPSLTVNVKESDPKNPAAGVYVKSGAVPDNVPWAGCEATAKDNWSSMSGSEPANVTAAATSSSVTTDWGVATGGWLPTITSTVADACAVRPSVSVTVSVAVNVPAAVYVCCGATPVPVAPSPNDHAYVVMPSSSELAEASNCTARGAAPLAGVRPN